MCVLRPRVRKMTFRVVSVGMALETLVLNPGTGSSHRTGKIHFGGEAYSKDRRARTRCVLGRGVCSLRLSVNLSD